MIENNARRLEATRVLPFQPLSLDFAKLVAERRADRVGAHVRREATNRHADDIQQRVNAENLRNEQERIGKLLRGGAVPAHLLAPVIRRVIEVADEDMEEDLRSRTTLLPSNHSKEEYQTTTREMDKEHYSGLEKFTKEEKKLRLAWGGGAPIRDMEALFQINTKIRARNAGFIRLQKKKREKAEAKAAAAATALPKAKAALPKPHPRPRVPP
jgi:hypothetical protein